MLLEDILLTVAIGAVLLVFGVPIVGFLKGSTWRRKDALAQAHERLRIAKREAEAARLNREAEKIYQHLYEETLADDRGESRARVDQEASPEQQAAEFVDGPTEKGKRNGQR